MNFQQLVTFSTVVNEGSMTAAAEKLFLTQPAVSQQIRNLEEELGVSLLDRSSRQARPTAQGQLLYDYARRIVSLSQQAASAVQSMSHAAEGELRIGTMNSLGLQLVAPAVVHVLKHQPKVKLSLVYNEATVLLEQLRRGELDAAVVPDASARKANLPEDVLGRFLTRDEIWLLASGRDTALPDEVGFEDLNDRAFIRLMEKYEDFERAFEEACRKTALQLRPVLSCNNVGTVKRVIEAGIGWGFLPSHSVRRQVRMGRLTRIGVRDFHHATPISLYHRPEHPSAPIADLLFQVLKQES